MTDYETAFPGDFPSAIKDFALKVSNGVLYGSRQIAADELRIPRSTFDGWAAGKPCKQEQMVRRAMTLIVREKAPALS